MILDKNNIKKILVVSLSNIGDIVLTFPVIDILKRDFPQAKIDLIVGPKGESLVAGNPNFGRIYVYHKGQSGLALLKWMADMAGERYDLAVDLRNTAIPFLVFAKHKTPLMIQRPQGVHMRVQHLLRLKKVYEFSSEAALRSSLHFSVNEPFIPHEKFVVFAPGSRAENKRWHEQGFSQLADALSNRYQVKPVFVGDNNDTNVIKRIMGMMKASPVDLSGKLTLTQLASLLSRASLAVVNDSAPMHLASYLNVPVVALFGPTDPKKYGPWSIRSFTIRKNGQCSACTGEKNVLHTCLQAISAQDVLFEIEPTLSEILNVRQKA